uniref:NADH-ubiquinone oxidoreductase chain 6 n=1 Tax=Hygrotus nigrolineatus TaxID=878038 RepID=A0A343C1K0_9DYTI|nr:NADH dehydrogenase subunit 6 [Hygrotus nigrolineatus]
MMMSMNMMINMIFISLNHPLSMGLILIMQTMIIAMMSSLYSMSFWYSYILFLIMIGGMLVLFMYMTSLASNEKFKMSNKLFILITMMMSMTFMLMLMDKSLINFMLKNNNLTEMYNNMNMFKNETLLSLNSIYNYPNNLITILLINYLLLTLVATVKITKSNTGPLRQKF